jgi:oligopeptide transport system permease protein
MTDAITLRQTVERRQQRTLLGDAIRRFRRNALAMIGLVILFFLFFLALFANIIAPFPPERADFSAVRVLPFTNSTYPLGTDAVGRDYMSRLIYGARTSMTVGLLVPIIGFSIGITLGALAGYLGGAVDFVVQRLVEIFTAVPPLLIALFLLSVTGSGLFNIIFVLSLTAWIEPTRLTRAQFLTVREKEFITSARALGATDVRLILTHLLPNILTPLLVAFTFAVPQAIFAEAGLSFLGLGITEPTASWGKMVGNAVGSTIRVYYHLALFPTLLVALTMLGFSFVGDGLQEALDPTRSR